MQPLELIDQMLSRTDFNCTRKQMEFLRELVVIHQDPNALKVSNERRRKIEIANAKRELTHARNLFEAAQENLNNLQKENI
jgi:hypothetical protein